jgi:RNA polymerase sigma-70 factor, ECF subfamily
MNTTLVIIKRIPAASPTQGLAAKGGALPADSYNEPRAETQPGHLDTMPSSRPAHEGASAIASSEEERLIEAARKRDAEAWSEIFDDNFQPLYRYAYYRTGDAAASEELASQVFEEALRGIKKFEYRGVPLRSWLFTIARNLVASHLASQARLKSAPLSEIAGPEELSASIEREEVRSALHELPEEQQQVIGLTLLEDLSPQECAQVMGKTVRQVNALQLQALRQLRTRVSRERAAP